jgi:hypothetical protein
MRRLLWGMSRRVWGCDGERIYMGIGEGIVIRERSVIILDISGCMRRGVWAYENSIEGTRRIY